MDLNWSPEDIAFREEVRAFLDEKLPKDLSDKVKRRGELTKADMERWHAILNEKGWLAPGWPKKFGGAEWNAVQKHIFEEEAARAGAPRIVPFGLAMLAPVLQKFGSKEQQDYYLPRILNGDDWWCQGYSEPGAGSDLASLKTRAVRDGDHYIVNGQKTWTTLGQHADWIFCLVRTDFEAKKQRGISFLLIDMKTPGITVRPILTLEGRHEVNEVFFDAVRVPVENLVGEENRGWDYAKFLLANERTGIARIGLTKERIARIKRLAREMPAGSGTMWDDPAFRGRVAEVEVELKALEITQMRVAAKQGRADSVEPDPASSLLKIRGSQLQQAATELLVELAGPFALAAPARGAGANNLPGGFDWVNAAAPSYFNNRKVSIYGGSNEIQHNVIAKGILGL